MEVDLSAGHGASGDNCDRPDDDNDDNACFMFESDHAALKGNSDYRTLLKTITLLEAQRIQAIRDVEDLQEAQEDALCDPIKFVEKLQRGETFNFPVRQEIASLPFIDWEKYQDFSSFGVLRHMTRLKKQLVDSDESSQERIIPSTSFGSTTLLDDSGEVTVVRGRIKTETKPATFNQLWTVEEQKRLEELLVVYPPEEVEAKRWQKIAIALGNRTTQQVASRVQKYFIKLAKAGLPIPGRMPNIGTNKKIGRFRNPRTLYQPSTFMQAYTPPVYMSDDEDKPGSYESLSEARFLSKYDHFSDTSSDESDDGDKIPLELRHSEEYRELQRLKSLRARKLQEDAALVRHEGYKCDSCQCEPIVGVRWHCVDCPESDSMDFCDGCVDNNIEKGFHNSSHRLKPVQQKINDSGMDQDYLPGDSNYLDPNFMPAN